ncbi:MAG TPA: hypothetical protein VHL09_17335 [Dehalococcoidia bacterium]|nr:hypothetical protein [Dehalococcoidia bacterium]
MRVSAYTFGLWPEGMSVEDGPTALKVFARRVQPWLAGVGEL